MSTYDPLRTYTVPSPQASVVFDNIPQGYTDLVLEFSGKITTSGANFYFQFNGDTNTNYSRTWMSGNGTTPSSGRTSNYGLMPIGSADSGDTVNIFHLLNYSNTSTYKTVLSRAGVPTGTYPGTTAQVGLWRSTNAITSILAGNDGNTFVAGSTFRLYGIKAA